MGDPARISAPRRWWRGTRVVLLLLLAFLLALAVGLSFRRIRPEPLAQWWYRRLLGVLQIRVEWTGARDPEARLVVANHVSWLDIVVIGAEVPARFIAKREVRDWPVIGWLAQAAGAFFIRRGSGSSKALVERLQPHMQLGGSVVLFPEGTTTDGSTVRVFHARIFDAAVASQCPVQPLALRYGRAPDGTAVAPFIGDDDFFPHLLRTLTTPTLSVEATLLPAVACEGGRAAMSRQARQAVLTALDLRDDVVRTRSESIRRKTAAIASSPPQHSDTSGENLRQAGQSR
ncbi:MAG: lysophospholipid acyltransferase family protein [Algiphilus sp.]